MTGITRRRLLAAGTAAAAAPLLSLAPAPARAAAPRRLVAAPASARLVGAQAPPTEVWSYDGAVPGPVLRLARGERLDVELENALPEATTLHWHGLRVPNAMDGVPHLTQPPIPPGERFRYTFTARDPGTFWYHPHFRSAEQLDRGLHGVIVVDDPDRPLEVDRELVWALDDWRLDGAARIVGDFGNLHDASHQGRMGNTATVNGVVPDTFEVRAGERVRLRLVNVANAWIFGLDFTGHAPRIVAYDGHAVPAHPPPTGLVVLGPSQRVDVVLDMTGAPGERFEIVDRYYPRASYRLADLVYAASPLRDGTSGAPLALPPPALAEPDLARAERHEIRFTGGAMGGLASARFAGEEKGIRELAGMGKVWAINGVVASRHDEPAFLGLALGRSYVLDMINDTAFAHPIHLHGHPMRVLDVDGREPPWPLWRDTLLMPPRSRARAALIADNPGRWMFHCHIPEHQEAGMMAVVEVA